LKISDEPSDQELFQRNTLLLGPGQQDAWGNAVQEQLKQYFATKPEATGMQIVVACREIQCQVQLTDPILTTTGESPSELIIDDLGRQPWFRKELVRTVAQLGRDNGNDYHVQYFDRKDAVSPWPILMASSELAAARASSLVSSNRADLYQLMFDQFKETAATSRMLTALVHAHEKVAGAQDDPAWARPIEQRMLEAFSSDPLAKKLDIISVACRRVGCEVQLFESNPSAKQTEIPAWFQVLDRMKKSDLGAAIEMDANFGARYGASVMYVATFKRKAG
jgi:hypothetical protein